MTGSVSSKSSVSDTTVSYHGSEEDIIESVDELQDRLFAKLEIEPSDLEATLVSLDTSQLDTLLFFLRTQELSEAFEEHLALCDFYQKIVTAVPLSRVLEIPAEGETQIEMIASYMRLHLFPSTLDELPEDHIFNSSETKASLLPLCDELFKVLNASSSESETRHILLMQAAKIYQLNQDYRAAFACYTFSLMILPFDDSPEILIDFLIQCTNKMRNEAADQNFAAIASKLKSLCPLVLDPILCLYSDSPYDHENFAVLCEQVKKHCDTLFLAVWFHIGVKQTRVRVPKSIKSFLEKNSRPSSLETNEAYYQIYGLFSQRFFHRPVEIGSIRTVTKVKECHIQILQILAPALLAAGSDEVRQILGLTTLVPFPEQIAITWDLFLIEQQPELFANYDICLGLLEKELPCTYASIARVVSIYSAAAPQKTHTEFIHLIRRFQTENRLEVATNLLLELAAYELTPDDQRDLTQLHCYVEQIATAYFAVAHSPQRNANTHFVKWTKTKLADIKAERVEPLCDLELLYFRCLFSHHNENPTLALPFVAAIANIPSHCKEWLASELTEYARCYVIKEDQPSKEHLLKAKTCIEAAIKYEAKGTKCLKLYIMICLQLKAEDASCIPDVFIQMTLARVSLLTLLDEKTPLKQHLTNVQAGAPLDQATQTEVDWIDPLESTKLSDQLKAREEELTEEIRTLKKERQSLTEQLGEATESNSEIATQKSRLTALLKNEKSGHTRAQNKLERQIENLRNQVQTLQAENKRLLNMIRSLESKNIVHGTIKDFL